MSPVDEGQAKVETERSDERADEDAGAEEDQEPSAKPEVAASGGGYRAIITVDRRTAWSCPHVHFTDHSARACAERNLRAVRP